MRKSCVLVVLLTLTLGTLVGRAPQWLRAEPQVAVVQVEVEPDSLRSASRLIPLSDVVIDHNVFNSGLTELADSGSSTTSAVTATTASMITANGGVTSVIPTYAATTTPLNSVPQGLSIVVDGAGNKHQVIRHGDQIWVR